MEKKIEKAEKKIEISEKHIGEFMPKRKEDSDDFLFEYTIPKFQRDFVWELSDIKELWDSIYRNYPIGSFIIWESDKKLPDYRDIANNIHFTRSESGRYKYILDGQQRITSLIVSILGGQKTPESRKKPISFKMYLSLKNAELEMKEEDQEKKKNVQLFFTEKEKIKQKPEDSKYLIEVGKLIEFDTKVYSNFYESNEKEYAQLYQIINHRIIHNYKLSIITLKNMPIEEVCELFTRVNVSGKKLTTIELITANTFHDDFYLKDYLELLDEELDRINFSDLDPIYIIRLISIIKSFKMSTEERKEKGLSCKEFDLFNLTAKDIKEHWQEACDSYKQAIVFLREMNITSPKIVPYATMLIPLGFYFYILHNNPFKEEDRRIINKWFWISALNGKYQGATNEAIAKDSEWLELLSKGEGSIKLNLEINLKKPTSINDPNIIIDETLNLSSGFCKTILCLMANKLPRDFTNHHKISIYEVLASYKKSELHHIFPDKCSCVQKYSKEKINSIANICFLPKESNQNISNKNPSEYFITFCKDKNHDHYKTDLESNIISPGEDSGVWNDDFEKFLVERASMIIDEIEERTK